MPRISNQDKIDQYLANPARTKKEGFKILGEIISCDNDNLCQYYLFKYMQGRDSNNPIGLASFTIKDIKHGIHAGSVTRITGIILKVFERKPTTISDLEIRDFIKTQSSMG
nr:hypothetical protein [Rickettsiaceae bacterium]